MGAKEGVAARISAAVGTAVTDTTFCTTDSQDFKSVKEYQLINMIQAVIDGSKRPAATDVQNLYVRLCST